MAEEHFTENAADCLGYESVPAKYPLEYRSWQSMKERCSPNYKGTRHHIYKDVKICDRWRYSFLDFVKDMGPKPPGTTIDRIDGTKGYEPGNCRWATRKEQNGNRKTCRMVTYNGRTQCAAAWADELGIRDDTFIWRLKNWPLEKAMTTALRPY